MASGNALVPITALSPLFPSSGAGAPGIDDQNRPFVKLALNEEFHVIAWMPDTYSDATGITTAFMYAMATGASDDIKIEMSLERIPDAFDTTAASFAAAQDSGDITVPGSAETTDLSTGALTHTKGAQMDSVVALDLFRARFKRVAVAGTDATGDLWFYGALIKET